MNLRTAGKLLFLAVLGCACLFLTPDFRFEPRYAMYLDSLNLYILQTLHDPGLFASDLAAPLFKTYSAAPTGRETAYFLVYKGLLTFLSVNAGMKLLSVLLLSCSAGLIFDSGRRLYGDTSSAFLLTVMFFVAFLSMDSFFYGQNRTFGAFLTILAFWAAVADKPLLVPALIFIFFPFYPFMSFTATVFAAFYFLTRDWSRGGSRAVYLAVAAVSLAATLAFDTGPSDSAGYTRAFAYKLLAPDGSPVDPSRLPDMALYFFLNLNEHTGLFTSLMALFSGLTAWSLVKLGSAGLRRLPAAAWALFLASFISFVFLYKFNPFFAARQVGFTVPLLLLLLAHGTLVWLIPAELLCHAAVAGGIAFMAAKPVYHPLEDLSPYAAAFSAIASDPEIKTLASPPDSLFTAATPFYTRKTAYYSSYLSDVYNTRAWGTSPEARARLLADGLCARTPAQLKNFFERSGVDAVAAELSFFRETCVDGAILPDLAGSSGKHLLPSGKEQILLVKRGELFKK